MIAVQVRDEDVVYLPPAYFVALHLRLCAFAAVYQQVFAIHAYYLRRGMALVSRQCRIVAEDGYFHLKGKQDKPFRLLFLRLIHFQCLEGCVEALYFFARGRQLAQLYIIARLVVRRSPRAGIDAVLQC